MKTLYLLRHAKSSWDHPATADFDRPLNQRGRKAARAIAKYLVRAAIRPRLVLCSAATRTRETLDRLGEALAGIDTIIDRGLYEATDSRLLARLHEVPDGTESVLLIGHNPGLERLAMKLCAGGDAEAIGRLREKYPTGALATLTAPLERWADLRPACCRLEGFVRPSDLE